MSMRGERSLLGLLTLDSLIKSKSQTVWAPVLYQYFFKLRTQVAPEDPEGGSVLYPECLTLNLEKPIFLLNFFPELGLIFF